MEPNFFNCINEWGANDTVVSTFGSALTVTQIGDRVLEISKDGELLGKVIEVRDNPGTFEIECGIANITKAIGKTLIKCGGKIVDNSENGGEEKGNGITKSNEKGNGKEQEQSNEEKINESKVDEKCKENNTENSTIESTQPKVADEVNEAPSNTLPSKPEPTKTVSKAGLPKKVEKSAPTVTTRSSTSDEFSFEEAKREMAYIRMLFSGPAGSGKTASALLVAYGLTGDWSKVGILDTENQSGSLYVNSRIGNTKIGKYKILTLNAPYTPERYIRAIDAAKNAGIEALIIDSITHAWASSGGLLDMQSKEAARTGNSYTAWKDVTPLHYKLVEKFLSVPMHCLLTVRSKTEYILEQNKNGKMAPKKVGMAAIFRDGIEYEVSTVFEMSVADHTAFVSKDRTAIFSDTPYFLPEPDTGKKILDWLHESN